MADIRSYLGFDFGTLRVGVASGNSLTGVAQPLRTIAVSGEARFVAIAALVQEWRPDGLVVGVPRHPDGAPHENTERARRFARQLHGRFQLPVHEVDERYTTVEVLSRQASSGSRQVRRADVDAASAALILNQFFDEAARGGGA